MDIVAATMVTPPMYAPMMEPAPAPEPPDADSICCNRDCFEMVEPVTCCLAGTAAILLSAFR